MKIRNSSTFMLNFGSYILYLLLLTIRYSAFGFTLDIRISTRYFDFYFAKFQFLCFIPTPSKCSPICFWFYLRYKIRKIIQSSVLSFPCVLKVVNSSFLLFISFFFFYCWIETCCLDILHQLCTVRVPVSWVVHIVGF